jgi:GR25 family glycosyltransferase involved in LPS biosynthesis
MTTLNNYFQEIHCINLKRRVDRWKECLEEFEKYDLKVNRYDAFDGNALSKIQGLNSGQVGTLYSHLGIVKYAKKSEIKNILILEDDIQFDKEINQKFLEIQSEIPEDWDMILFGGNHAENNPWSPGKLFKITEHVYKVTHSLALHCYAINHTIYDKVIDILSEKSYPADVLIANIQQNINCYIIRPHLAWQRPSFSDLREMYVDMPFLYNDRELYEGRYFGPEMLKRDDVRDKLTEREKIMYDREKEIYLENLK